MSLPVLRTIEDIDTFFHEMEAQRRPIGKELDLDIRMSLKKVKLQLYYDAKLKEYRKKYPMPSNGITEPKPRITKNIKEEQKIPIVAKQEKKKKKKEEKQIRSIDPNAVRLSYITVRTPADVDTIVAYFKANEKDLNPITDYWVRFNIIKGSIRSYYKQSMSKAFSNYNSIMKAVKALDLHGLSERRRKMLENFRTNLYKFKENGNEVKNVVTPKVNKKENTSFEVLKKKEWILDWNCVMFKRGSVVIYSRSDLPVKFKPETVNVPKTIESFNYLRKYLNERLPPIRCSIVGLKLTVVDKINFNDAILQFAAASRQGVIKISGMGSHRGYAPTTMSFQQALSKAKQMTPEDFKKYKSQYIDFLVTEQSKNYKVIPCVERLAHTTGDNTEYAFMFSIDCRSKDVLIVHENVNPDRSTLLFIVKRENYEKSIRAIYNFLQSAEINKRSSIRSRDIEKDQVGIEAYNSINHDDLYSWKRAITRYKLHYQNGYVFIY